MKDTLSIDDVRAALRLMKENDRRPPQPTVVTPQEAKRLGVNADNPSFKIVPRVKL